MHSMNKKTILDKKYRTKKIVAISLIYLIIYTRYLLKAIRLIILIINGEYYEN